MNCATHSIGRLAVDETISFRPRGHSMTGKVNDGQLVTAAPVPANHKFSKGDRETEVHPVHPSRARCRLMTCYRVTSHDWPTPGSTHTHKNDFPSGNEKKRCKIKRAAIRNLFAIAYKKVNNMKKLLTKKTNNKGSAFTEHAFAIALVALLAIIAISPLGANVRNLISSAVSAMINEIGTEDQAVAETSAECYNPSNLNKVGASEMTGCAGMLIVDNAQIRSAASQYAHPSTGTVAGGGGDESYSIMHGGQNYTFANSGLNVFTGQVTDISYLFHKSTFNGDIGYWDTSAVVNMEALFSEASLFNQDIGSWDTSSTTNMTSAFYYAEDFFQDLTAWTVIQFSSVPNNFNTGATQWNTDYSLQPHWTIF